MVILLIREQWLGFSLVGFSQTAEKSSGKKGACCDKDKTAACCAKDSKKSCADTKSIAAKSDLEMATPLTATEPRKKEKADKKKKSDL